MGRWAQYRHRGRGESAPVSEFPQSPPAAEFWWPNGIGGRLDLNTSPGFPDASWSIQAEWRLQPDIEWTGTVTAGEETNVIVVDPASLGDTYDMRARWVSGITPDILSDWATVQSAIIEV